MWVADIGPGTGRSYPFKPRASVGSDVVFVDVEPPAAGLKMYGEWVVADAQRLPLRDESVSTIFASHVLEHLERPWIFLSECYRVLKARGMLHLILPNFLSVNARRDPSHKRVYNVISVALMLKKAGFTVHFEHRAGSLLPEPFRKILSVAMNFLSEEIRLLGEKQCQ